MERPVPILPADPRPAASSGTAGIFWSIEGPIKDVYMSTEVVAIVVAVFSLLVSLYATRLAKTAPDREQLRALKDDLRVEVVQVRRIVSRLQKQVDAGKFVDEPDEKLESVSQLLSENLHRFRIQETGR